MLISDLTLLGAGGCTRDALRFPSKLNYHYERTILSSRE